MQTYNNFLWTSCTISDPWGFWPNPVSHSNIGPGVDHRVQAAVTVARLQASAEHSGHGVSNEFVYIVY